MTDRAGLTFGGEGAPPCAADPAPGPPPPGAGLRIGAGRQVCLVAGTRVATESGPIAVEALVPGDRILTRRHGFQPLRRCGSVTRPSEGVHAAIYIPAGTFGDHGALRVAPRHRLLFCGWRAELFCGRPEVMVPAAHLVREGLLRQDRSGCPVSYFHLRFDRAEIVSAEGLWGESPLPGGRAPPAPPGPDGAGRAHYLVAALD